MRYVLWLTELTLTSTVPLSKAMPLTLASEDVLELRNTVYCASGRNVRLPATVIVEPGVPLPGAKMPPLLTSRLPTVPVPISMAPALTVVRLDDAIEPSTSSTPPFTAHGIVA